MSIAASGGGVVCLVLGLWLEWKWEVMWKELRLPPLKLAKECTQDWRTPSTWGMLCRVSS